MVKNSGLSAAQSNFLKPMSLAYSLKHWWHMSKPYILPDEAVAVRAGAASARALAVLSRPGVPDVFETHLEIGNFGDLLLCLHSITFKCKQGMSYLV
jgi:hypothetical protein